MQEKSQIVIDGENAVLGRLASFSAKQALLGKEIIIVNAEKVVIVGREKDILFRYKKKRARGGSGMSGPYFSVDAEKILKRTVRNMMPYKKGRGREALKRIKCFSGMPEEFSKMNKIKSSGKRAGKGISLYRLSKLLRGGK